MDAAAWERLKAMRSAVAASTLLCLLLAPLKVAAQEAPSAEANSGQAQGHGIGEEGPDPDSAIKIQQMLDRIASDPTDAEAYTQLGILYARENLLEDARGAFISALQAAPQEPSSHLNLGLILLRMERWQEARLALESFNQMTPESAQGYALVGRTWEGEGNLEQARKVWVGGSKFPSMSVEDRVALLQEVVRSYVEDREPSEDDLKQLAQTLRSQPELLAAPEAAELRESVRYSYLEAARLANERQDQEDALRAFAQARAAGATEGAAFTQPLEILLQQERYEDARALVDEARQRLPESAVGPYMAGRLAVHQGDPEAAAVAYREAARADPDFPGVQAALGEVLAQLGDERGATEALSRAVEKGEGGAVAAYNMGVVLSKKEQFAEAIPHLAQAIELDPSLKEAYRALGIAYRKTDRYVECADVYQQLIARFGPDPRDLYQLAFAQAKLDRHREAAQNYAMVTALEPDNRLAHYNLGNSYMKLDQHEKAAEQFEQALQLEPGNELALYNLALAHQKMENYDEAIRNYELALEQKVTYRSYVNLAICYKAIGNEELSDEYYRLAAELRGGGR